jgi:hypothetical protein
MEKVSWTDRVRNIEKYQYRKVSHRVKEEGNILHTVNRRTADWFGHISVETAF